MNNNLNNKDLNNQKILLDIFNYLGDIADCLDYDDEETQFSMELFSEFCDVIKYVYRSYNFVINTNHSVNPILIHVIIRLAKLCFFPQKIKPGLEYECIRLLCSKTIYAIESHYGPYCCLDEEPDYLNEEDFFLSDCANEISTLEYVRDRKGDPFYPCGFVWYDFEKDTPEMVLNGVLKDYAEGCRKYPENYDVNWSIF